jgi:transcriptional regulator with XRE-family HTH domain
MKKFGELIKGFREKAGLSQYEISDLVKIHPSHISRLERGERKPRLKNVIRFINALSLNEEDGNKLLQAAGYSSKINRPLVFHSPLGLGNFDADIVGLDTMKINNPAIKAVFDVLSDPELSTEAKKEIAVSVKSLADWLRDKMKKEYLSQAKKH